MRFCCVLFVDFVFVLKSGRKVLVLYVLLLNGVIKFYLFYRDILYFFFIIKVIFKFLYDIFIGIDYKD